MVRRFFKEESKRYLVWGIFFHPQRSADWSPLHSLLCSSIPKSPGLSHLCNCSSLFSFQVNKCQRATELTLVWFLAEAAIFHYLNPAWIAWLLNLTWEMWCFPDWSEAGWSNRSHLGIWSDGPVCQGKASAFPPELTFPVPTEVEIPPPFPTVGAYELMGNQDYPSPTHR